MTSLASDPQAALGTNTVSRFALEGVRPAPFVPREPQTQAETGLSPLEIEALCLKILLNQGSATGRKIAEQLKLSFGAVFEVLRSLKAQMLVAYKSSAPMNDYEHDLTDIGIERAQRWAKRCTYCGAAPVPLKDYVAAMHAQSVRKQRPKFTQVASAFKDLALSPAVINQIGQAVTSGKGMFLYGAPGNGKTSIAERIISTLGDSIWIPRAISVGGEIVRLFDPANHFETPMEGVDSGLYRDSKIDRRWIRIRRPTVVVGGELTLEHLEMNVEKHSGTLEAPLQMKSNCGALVIDDFGRQRIPVATLLNRWIIPLEKGFDYQSLPGGRQIQVPFDQLLVFATNLHPRELVDEAFLRRIPYKVEIADPTEREFIQLFADLSGKMGIRYDESAVRHLIERHYVDAQRGMRYCHPRDLLLQVKTLCEFQERPVELTPAHLDQAALNYFAGL